MSKLCQGTIQRTADDDIIISQLSKSINTLYFKGKSVVRRDIVEAGRLKN